MTVPGDDGREIVRRPSRRSRAGGRSEGGGRHAGGGERGGGVGVGWGGGGAYGAKPRDVRRRRRRRDHLIAGQTVASDEEKADVAAADCSGRTTMVGSLGELAVDKASAGVVVDQQLNTPSSCRRSSQDSASCRRGTRRRRTPPRKT